MESPDLNEYECIGCWTCEMACPVEAIELGDAGIPVFDSGACVLCGGCVESCPQEALSINISYF